jgi:hypothetical protein
MSNLTSTKDKNKNKKLIVQNNLKSETVYGRLKRLKYYML